MKANRKSDGLIVPAKQANKTGTPVAESAEERRPPEGNVVQLTLHRTQSRAMQVMWASDDGW
jgi:hypothetical protein